MGRTGWRRRGRNLPKRDVALILDYVPNHVAADHPWVTDRPDYFLAGSDAELASHPEEFMEIDGVVFAKGRDPYIEPWQDVLQLNAFSPALREAAADTVTAIGDQCDGVRCDMAMLMTNEVFARTWGERASPAPEADFWPTLIARSRQAHADLLFMAEVYRDMEWTLQQQGFDLCYDKRLYDRLVHDEPDSVRGHLQADGAYQQRLIRFIENHDEPRTRPNATITSRSSRHRPPERRVSNGAPRAGTRLRSPLGARCAANPRALPPTLAPSRRYRLPSGPCPTVDTVNSDRVHETGGGPGRTHRRAIWSWSTSHRPTPRAGCDCRGAISLDGPGGSPTS